MKIAIVSAEIFPFAKTGGLGDVTGALGKYLKKSKQDVRLVTPFYSSTNIAGVKLSAVKSMQNIETWLGSRKIVYSVHKTKLPGSTADVYLVSCPEFYNRWSIYTEDADEHLRFGLLNRAVLEICQYLKWAPDIIHCNDWQTALIPLYLKTVFAWDGLFKKTKKLYAIHNIGYQGSFSSFAIPELGFQQYQHLLDAGDLKLNLFNFMKLGIIHADKLSTVSETYAKEIQTAEYGHGLHEMLAYRKFNLVGIVNGVDYEEWNPETDPHLSVNYALNNVVSGKQKNKKVLLEKVGLKFDKKTPLVGMITRLVEQKGIDLMMQVLENFLFHKSAQFVILGSGQKHYEEFFVYLQSKYPDKLAFYAGYNAELSHLIEAGSDMFLMPSHYEPCGLNQIYSLKYGTVPIVRKTGGMADTVDFYDWQTQTGTGFVFEDYSPAGLDWAINSALETYKNKTVWNKIIKAGMQKNYSWEQQIKEYILMYKSMLA